jgi:hypothetical protein
MKNIVTIGKMIYDTDNPREQRRFFVFVIRSIKHYKAMQELIRFFYATPLKKELITATPFFIEQVTRQLLYKNSTFNERKLLIYQNINFLIETFSAQSLQHIYMDGQGVELWQEIYQEKKLSLQLKFEGGQKKEGTMSIILKWEKVHLYQMIFWLAEDKVSDQYALYIGAMQGPNVDHANEIIKGLTKRFFGYRTKNLILYATRAFARAIGISAIYAVTNEGYYANNHVRVDRKLKTSFSDFWAEAGGIPCEDQRFYELPLTEYRKTIEEVKSHKRAQYRNRFAILDEIDRTIELTVKQIIK